MDFVTVTYAINGLIILALLVLMEIQRRTYVKTVLELMRMAQEERIRLTDRIKAATVAEYRQFETVDKAVENQRRGDIARERLTETQGFVPEESLAEGQAAFDDLMGA